MQSSKAPKRLRLDRNPENASIKRRKLIGAEKQPGGLLIVRGTRKSPSVPLPTAAPSTNGKAKKPQSNGEEHIDFSAPLASSSHESPSKTPGEVKYRRRSSLGRGKRMSTAFDNTGIITQPHSSVADTSFYKHIDNDLPEPERIRQLLIWCSSRAASYCLMPPITPTTPTPTGSSSNSAPALSASPRPCSDAGMAALRRMNDTLIRKLAERRFNVGSHQSEVEPSQAPMVENTQNLANRRWEITYSSHIKTAAEEDEEWKKARYILENHMKNSQVDLQKRRAAFGRFRQKDTEPSLQSHSDLSLEPVKTGTGNGDPARKGKEAELDRRMGEAIFKLHRLHSIASSLRSTVNIADNMLTKRFAMLRLLLDMRGRAASEQDEDMEGDGIGVLKKYVAGTKEEDPRNVLLALSRVDTERPPAMISDAAHRAVREVQRVQESGRIGVVGERRYTGLPTTPRKVPGTPRRGNTPAKDRER